MFILDWTNEAPDPVHLALIQQGIDIWNEWRLDNQEIIPSFHKAEFQGLNLAKANFRKADFKEADLRGANLKGVNFKGANLYKADLRGANLNEANLEDSDLREANLSNAELNGAQLNGANLSNATLIETQLLGASLGDANCGRANFSRANLSRICALRANFGEAIFIKANLIEAYLFSTHFYSADFTQAVLCKARFEGAHLTGAIFNDADLSKANFSWADLSDADLSKACLYGADLTRTRALGTNFYEANLDEVCIEDWHINSSTNLSRVTCLCIYLKGNQQERRPYNGFFAPEEFSRRYQILANILELSFHKGIPWKALAIAFHEVNNQVLHTFDDELFLQEYKTLGDGLITLKVIYPSQANGNEIREKLEARTHELELQLAQLKGELKAKDDTLSQFERLFQPKNISPPCRIYIDQIDSFVKVRSVSFDAVSHLLSNGYFDISEEKVQLGLEAILSEKFHKKDWGGEYNDLYTSNLVFSGVRRSTAFLLKGNGLRRKRTMEIRDCGKNGDQLLRLLESPAELFVIQYVGNIAEAIVKDVENKIEHLRFKGKNVHYCVINGQDTARLLYAYDLNLTS